MSSFTPLFLNSGFNVDHDVLSHSSGLKCEDASLTQQSFAEEADINTIVNRFMRTGVLPDPVSMPQYVDYEGVFDFQSAMNVVRAADENFMRLDARVRSRFNNSPQAFLEFFSNPDNYDEGVRLGLVVPTPVKQDLAPKGTNVGPAGAVTDAA
jgi:phage internal scaffolding protein